jgi:hypothetical protein
VESTPRVKDVGDAALPGFGAADSIVLGKKKQLLAVIDRHHELSWPVEFEVQGRAVYPGDNPRRMRTDIDVLYPG